ncbi:MAG: hypothetical protein JXR95_15030 [Deltaproteobacteria bacterium]|nr:hypothetical protein [Deltaproteobacteria bacterium]
MKVRSKPNSTEPILIKYLPLIEFFGFLVIIIMLWLDELFDLPALVLGAPATPVNWRESLLETVFVLITGSIVIFFTAKILKKMKQLESYLPVCANCRKIRNSNDEWEFLENFLLKNTDTKVTHTVCPDCAKLLYGDYYNETE